jgi:hypothetical protein
MKEHRHEILRSEISEEEDDLESLENEDQEDSPQEEEDKPDEVVKETNGFRLIFPSKRNTEEEYQEFMDHSQKCYEQFTGSYSRKNREEKEAKAKPQVNRFVIKTVVSPYKQLKVEEKVEPIERDFSQEIVESD